MGDHSAQDISLILGPTALQSTLFLTFRTALDLLFRLLVKNLPLLSLTPRIGQLLFTKIRGDK